MGEVVIKNLVKIYAAQNGPAVPAVKGINLTINDREFMVLVGPSGCGKTTTLRMIAGLEEISGGTISIDGKVVNQIPPKDRDIAMVFQNYALYPHLSVYDNMAFGLQLRKFPKAEIDTRVHATAVMLGLEAHLDRKPKALSGGQRQRVAVGRAIVRQPRVFLFDEPLSNLDAQMRVSMRTEISKLHARLGVTMVYVTHDQAEAMTMGDRLCVMQDGNILQVAPPLEIYNHPANLFVAGFIGSPPMNFFRGTIRQAELGVSFIEDNSSSGAIRLPLPDSLIHIARQYVGKGIILGIRPENVHELSPASGEWPGVTATVEVSEPLGAETLVYLHTGANSFIARMAPTTRVSAGEQIAVAFNPGQVHLFDAQTELALV